MGKIRVVVQSQVSVGKFIYGEIMMKKCWMFSFMLLLGAVNFGIGVAAEDIKVVVQGQQAAVSYQVVDEGKLLVSVLDDGDEPIRGLTGADFMVGSGIQKAEIISAAPLETTEVVPLNIVFVVDNSFSMKERRAVKSLLAAMDEFLKTVRPIDNIHLVVFDDQAAMKVEQDALHTSSFNSSDVSELQNFLKDSLGQRSTGKTFLYEAMAAGVEIVRRMPAITSTTAGCLTGLSCPATLCALVIVEQYLSIVTAARWKAMSVTKATTVSGSAGMGCSPWASHQRQNTRQSER